MVSDYSAFRQSELEGWSERADAYDTATALATTQSIPALLGAARVFHGASVLDVGCGPGYAAGAAAAMGAQAKGIDFSPQMVALARQRFPAATFAVGDAERLDEPDDCYEAVVSNIVFFHVTDPALALAEACRVLKPGGRFAFSQWCGPDESDLYRDFLKIVGKLADLSIAEPAPDAFALSDRARVEEMMMDTGFRDCNAVTVSNVLRATGGDFFAFFQRFGVRIPLILSKQTPEIRNRIRDAVNDRFSPYRQCDIFAVPMPSIVYSGARPE